MLVVVSPAKKLDEKPAELAGAATRPGFQDEAYALSRTARRLSVARLQKLMSISQNLAKLNQARFRSFDLEPAQEATKTAALMFAGDTYIGLEAETLDGDELAYAQDHLKILSGLYGLLRPLDQIQPHRLEMGSRLATRRGKNLYQFWGRRIAEALNGAASETGAQALVNCASVEYFTAVDPEALALPVITPVFMEEKPGGPEIVSFFAKRARGAMARFIVQRRITDPDGLKDFDTGGYRFQPEMSEENRLVFVRDGNDG